MAVIKESGMSFCQVGYVVCGVSCVLSRMSDVGLGVALPGFCGGLCTAM